MASELIFAGLGLSGADGMSVKAMNALKECDMIYAEFYTSHLIGTEIEDLEKALGKKAFGESCTDLVVKKPGKPTLVPESDKRPVFDPAASVFSVIN